jgi:hypothetical protein
VVVGANSGRSCPTRERYPETVVEYVAEEPWTFSAELVLPLASARATVWEYGPGPGPFRSLANDWRGWDGERSYSSLEGQLHLNCRHDGKGLVEIRVTFRSPEPPGWSLSATINLGAGAHLEGPLTRSWLSWLQDLVDSAK